MSCPHCLHCLDATLNRPVEFTLKSREDAVELMKHFAGRRARVVWVHKNRVRIEPR